MDSKEIERQLNQLAREYSDTLSERLGDIAKSIDQLEAGRVPAGGIKELYRQVHKLSGSAATFGYPKLGRSARQLELDLRYIIDHGQSIESRALANLRLGIQRLYQLAAEGPSSDFLILSDRAEERPQQTRKEQRGYLIYIIEEELAAGREMAAQLVHFGYEVEVFGSVAEVVRATQERCPAALIVDVEYAGTELLPVRNASLELDENRRTDKEFPIVFTSVRGDWQARLAAVRAGGNAYMLKPVDVPALVSYLDRLLMRHKQEPYRILIIDDDPRLASHYALVLQKAGMHAQTLNDPEKIFKAMVEFRPELILMDIYMEKVSGIEAAQVVRQHQELFSIPVVFLSTEEDLDKQLLALQQGDDFLQKPIRDDHLVQAVVHRAERTRALGALMYYDGLTGVLNHSCLKQQLDAELARASRQNSCLSFVLLDLDHFKRVNDEYGHAAGDRVLKSIANLLQDRLRQMDQVGRYGGEEFGVILPETEGAVAMKIIDELRERFANIRHLAGDKTFICTFSAGIAITQNGATDTKTLIETADHALYQAKENGRNQIVVANQNVPSAE